MKLLVIRFSSLGDIVMTSPVIRCLKKQVNDAEIHFLTYDVNRSAVEYNPSVDALHVVAHSWELVIEQLKTEDYSFIIDLQNDHRSARIKSNLPVKTFTLEDHDTRKAIYTSFKINMMPATHRVDRYFRTVASLEVKNDGRGLDYFISPKDETKREDIPASHHAGYIACAIGALYGTRRWPLLKWKEFATKMDHPIILVGTNEDLEWANVITAIDPVRIYNACGKFTINETADLIKKAKLVIAHDNDWMHIAAAYQRPIISLWGNTVPSFGVYPYYGSAETQYPAASVPSPPARFDILQVSKLWCRPCSAAGYYKCPRGHFKCMEKIRVDELVASVKKRL